MTPFDAYEAVVALGGRARHAERVASIRQAFEARTGAFRPEDAWFEPRSRAFWDDVVTRHGFAREVEPELDSGARAWVAPFERAHRGLFRVHAAPDVAGVLLVDAWSGAELVVNALDESSREALDAAAGLFDGRVAAAATTVALLPGALFHREDATEAIDAVLGAARARGLETDDVLDALLRMERSLRSLSRVKTAYAYRVEGLDRAIDGTVRRAP